jgi:hypothetical protein
MFLDKLYATTPIQHEGIWDIILLVRPIWPLIIAFISLVYFACASCFANNPNHRYHRIIPGAILFLAFAIMIYDIYIFYNPVELKAASDFLDGIR